MSHQDVFRYSIAALFAVLYLWFLGVLAYAAWKGSKDE